MADGSQTTRPNFTPEAQKIVAAQQARRDAFPVCGVTWSAMHREAPEVETLEAVTARLEAQYDRQLIFARTPRGRFVAAANLIAEATGDERLWACHCRGLETNHEHAARVLAEMEGPAAEQARAALAEFVALLPAEAA